MNYITDDVGSEEQTGRAGWAESTGLYIYIYQYPVLYGGGGGVTLNYEENIDAWIYVIRNTTKICINKSQNLRDTMRNRCCHDKKQSSTVPKK
jgi:hypothetical protein